MFQHHTPIKKTANYRYIDKSLMSSSIELNHHTHTLPASSLAFLIGDGLIAPAMHCDEESKIGSLDSAKGGVGDMPERSKLGHYIFNYVCR